MATANMNTVQGKIVVKETGAGCANLLVVIYDLDPNTRPEELIEAISGGSRIAVRSAVSVDSGSKNTLGGLGDRIGSLPGRARHLTGRFVPQMSVCSYFVGSI